jgi:serine/threonine protein kinase/class 3 adenylate cyclase
MNLGPYRLLVHLGPGNPGDWYQALDDRDDRPVRVLVCWAETSTGRVWPPAARRLRLLAQLKHSAVFPLVHLALDHEHPHAVWEEPPAVSLKNEFDGPAKWSEKAVLELGLTMCDVLAEAHRLGIVHGKLAPSEIYLEGDSARVDFAHTVGLQESCLLTAVPQPGNSRGERDSEREPAQDSAADLFSLGTILFRMLHGDDAFGPCKASSPGDGDQVKSLHGLIEFMLADDRDARLSANEARAILARLGDELESANKTRVGTGQEASTPVVTFPDDRPAASVKQVGRYQLSRKLGEGGLGVVYLARDPVDDRQVAIKVLHRRFSDSSRVVRRFKKEARLLANVQSPHVCRLFEYNEDAGLHYLVLEYLQGQNLGKVLERHKKLPERLALAIVADAARALAEAHRRGIIHRDIKPDNIMLVGAWANLADDLPKGTPAPEAGGDVRVKLCDFGMARHLEQSQSLDVTVAGMAMGTPLYMSPEQANGEADITPSSDVYSLGVTLFHLLTGRPPFQANTVPALIAMHATQEAPSPTSINPDLSSAVAQVVLKAMAKAPAARYADAEAFLADLERLLRGEPTTLVVHPRLPQCQPSELLVYDWSWEFAANSAELWPLVSNTERFNQAVGMAAVDFFLRKIDSTDNDIGPRVERYGAFRKAGMTHKWREHAYEWVEGKRMCVLREYSEGVFRWFASIVELQPRAGGGATLRHSVRIVPRGRFGRIIAAIEVGFRGRRAVDAVYRRIDAYLTNQVPRTAATDAFVPQAAAPVRDEATRRRLVDKLALRGVHFALAETLVEFALNAAEQEIARIRPIPLAQRLRREADDVIDACLVAAHEGIFILLWDILCPKCQVPSSIQETMRAIQGHGECQACNLDFELDFANSVELVFRIHPSLRTSETGLYCVGGPSHSPHVVAQVRVAAGERLELALALSEGPYRLRGPQLPYTIDLRVHPEARASRGEIFLKRGPGAEFPRTFKTGAQTVLLNNDHTDELVVRIERAVARTDALTAARASSLARFRDLFPQEVLSGNQLVSIAHVTLLTTSLVDASRLYEMGDARAFGIVHEHFRLLEGHIRKEAGALVKTVREGMVAVFIDSAAAVRVALDLQTLLSRNEATKGLKLRTGIHAGPAMAATLNGKLDYFGATVNLAMTLAGLAPPGDVVVTQPLAADPQVQALLRARGLSSEVLPDAPDGLPVYRLEAARVAAPSRAAFPAILKLKTPAV